MKKTVIKILCLALAVSSVAFVGCDDDDDKKEQSQEQNDPNNNQGNGGEILSGKFSVAQGKYVKFSPGNLQYTTSGTHKCADGTNQLGTWRFAPNQWDVVGSPSYYNRSDGQSSYYDYYAGNVANSDNALVSSSYTGWIDLFGWGTSGYNGKYPYMTSTGYSDYGDGNKDIAQTYYDWGVYNTIGTDAPGTWRTLTKAEWIYLLQSRTNADKLYGVAMVNGVNGCILLPDDWTLPSGVTFTAGEARGDGSSYYKAVNNYTLSQWETMEKAGAVFLPAAGYRSGTGVNYVGYYGYYWSASYGNSGHAYYFDFSSFYVITNNYLRHLGQGVRLVSDFK